ncbi:KilA-N domain-containing protein, partial [Phocaeicola vulgatus]
MIIGVYQLLIKVKRRNTKEGKTPDIGWMNPLLFIKFAMWIKPAFEVKVLRFVYATTAIDTFNQIETFIAGVT